MKKITNLIPLFTFIMTGCNEDSANKESNFFQPRLVYDKLYQESLSGKSIILKYNTLPNDELIKVFTDKEYEKKIINEPNLTLEKYIIDENIELIAHPHIDNNQIAHFAIPYIDISDLNKEDLYRKLRQDYKDIKVGYILPYNILSNAILDVRFRERLLKEPRKILQDFGYDLKYREIIIHVDTKNKKNIIIPKSPINSLEINEYKKGTQYLQQRYGVGSCSNCHRPYDTKSRIECTSLPTCL